jgi:copper chaperone NosL
MRTSVLASLILGMALAACDAGPREIRLGAEECAHCRMLVSESRFASQLLTDRGRSYVFDSIECMAEFLDEAEEVPEDRVRSLWVTDFHRPGVWLPVEAAVFLRSEDLRSPMGLNLSAYVGEAEAARARTEHGGELLSWAGVRELVSTTRVRGGHSHAR